MRWLTAYKVSGVVWRCGGGGGVGNVVVYHYRCELPLYRPATATVTPPRHRHTRHAVSVSIPPPDQPATSPPLVPHSTTRYVTTSSLMLEFLPVSCVPPWNWIVLIEFLVEVFPEIDSDI